VAAIGDEVRFQQLSTDATWKKSYQPRYNVVCKKRKRGVILLGRFLAKYNPNGKEDTPHVRIVMEGNCT
jgi:hypothetical protein